jgi:hypothetical protein
MEGAQKVILVAAYDSTVFVLSATSGLLIRILEGHTKTVFSLQVRTYQDCFLILITGKKKIWTLLMTMQRNTTDWSVRTYIGINVSISL